MDKALPGPSLEQLIAGARCVRPLAAAPLVGWPLLHVLPLCLCLTPLHAAPRPCVPPCRGAIQGVMGAARDRVTQLLPSQSLDAAAAALAGGIDAAVAALSARARAAQEEGGALDRVAVGVEALAGRLRAAGEELGAAANATTAEFPGPLAQAALDAVGRQVGQGKRRRLGRGVCGRPGQGLTRAHDPCSAPPPHTHTHTQANASAARINASVAAALAAVPGLDPQVWVPEAEAALNQLIDALAGQAGPLAAVAPAPLAAQVADVLPGLVDAAGRVLDAAASGKGPGAAAHAEAARALQATLGGGVAAAQGLLAAEPLVGVVAAVEAAVADAQVGGFGGAGGPGVRSPFAAPGRPLRAGGLGKLAPPTSQPPDHADRRGRPRWRGGRAGCGPGRGAGRRRARRGGR
jgi:hypothetical protein